MVLHLTGEEDIVHDEVLTMISDDEEELNFLTGAVDSSSSEEDENVAMVSQELRPGFLDPVSSEVRAIVETRKSLRSL